MALIRSGKIKEHILLVRGGTTTFLAPALSLGAIGIITMSGAPESHLGILSREFQTPCVMTAGLVDSTSRYVPGETGDAHFDKFVEIACRDCEKFHAFEQGIIRIKRLFENALVELQPGKMAIEEQFGIGQLNSRHGCL